MEKEKNTLAILNQLTAFPGTSKHTKLEPNFSLNPKISCLYTQKNIFYLLKKVIFSFQDAF